MRSWLSENLPANAPGLHAQTWQTITPSNEEEPTYSYFQLYEWTDKEVLVCSVASFALTNHKGGTSEGGLFTCNCPGSPLDTTSPHRTQLEALKREFASFPWYLPSLARLLLWLMYFVALNDSITLQGPLCLSARESLVAKEL